MIIWVKSLRTVPHLPSLPGRITIASEARMSYEDYHFYGKTRKGSPNIVFKYTLAGEGCFLNSSGEHRIKKGSGFLCNVRDPETGYYYPKDGTEPWRYIYISLIGSCALDMVKDINDRYGHIFTLPENRGIIQTMSSFSGRTEDQIMVSPSESLSLMMELISALVKSKEQTISHSTENLLIKRFQKTIEQHVDENINVSQIADIMDISREHLARIFKEYMGVSPHEFLQNYKMRFACHMLKESSMSIKQISNNLGYDQPGHFTRTFKRAVGVPPREFREKGSLTSFK
ncbi:MAG: AraC family transcriptional regulator [Planctomycetota bacterium]|jgi:AraC-like DNA-binding protein